MELYILDGHNPVPASGRNSWGRWMETANVHVAIDSVGDVTVSTVFLGIGPILFETMVFGGSRDQSQWRYGTWAEAEAGHKRVVEMVKEGEQPENHHTG